MRFFNVVLAATLLASINAVSNEMNQGPQLVEEIASRSVVSVQDSTDVKRNLRKYVEEDDSFDALDYIDPTEERNGPVKIDFKKLEKLAGTKKAVLPVNLTLLNAKHQDKLFSYMYLLNQHQFAKKIGMRNVDDIMHVNFPYFEKFQKNFTP